MENPTIMDDLGILFGYFRKPPHYVLLGNALFGWLNPCLC